MGMKTAAFTTISDPLYWQYAFKECIDCYSEIFDEVVVVDGSLTEFEYVQSICKQRPNVKYVRYPWPYEFKWEEFPRHVEMGYRNISEDIDVAMRMDIDYYIHESDVMALRMLMEKLLRNNSRVACVKKFTVMSKDYGFIKATMPIIVNMHLKENIDFVKGNDTSTDWCFPVDKTTKVPIEPSEFSAINLYNYDYFFRDLEKSVETFYRFSRAAQRDFNEFSWGNTYDECKTVVTDRFKGFMNKRNIVDITSHPKWISERVKNMKPQERGFNNWGMN